MPVTWHLDESGLLTVTGTGTVTDEEYLEAHKGFLAATAPLKSPRRSLADWSGVTTLLLTGGAVRASAGLIGDGPRLRGGDHRIVLVATTPAVFGMCRMWQTLMSESGIECAVMRSREEALAWLRR